MSHEPHIFDNNKFGRENSKALLKAKVMRIPLPQTASGAKEHGTVASGTKIHRNTAVFTRQPENS